MSSAGVVVDNMSVHSDHIDEVPHAYDQEYENPYTYAYSEVSAFEYDNKINKAAVTTQRPNHHILTIKDPKNPTKKAQVSIFDTDSNMGATIFNASSGIPYFSDESQSKTYRVGSKYESTLYKVRDVRFNGAKNKTFTLYYDSPSQYERHLLVKLPQSAHEKWYNRSKTQ